MAMKQNLTTTESGKINTLLLWLILIMAVIGFVLDGKESKRQQGTLDRIEQRLEKCK